MSEYDNIIKIGCDQSGQLRVVGGPQDLNYQLGNGKGADFKQYNDDLNNIPDWQGKVCYLADNSKELKNKGIDVKENIDRYLTGASPKEVAEFLGDENNLRRLTDAGIGYDRETLKKQKVDAGYAQPIIDKLNKEIKDVRNANTEPYKENQKVFDYLKNKEDEYNKLAKETGGGVPKIISDIYKRNMNTYEFQAGLDTCDADDINGKIRYLRDNRELWTKKGVDVDEYIIQLEMSRPRTLKEKIDWLNNNKKDFPKIDIDKEIKDTEVISNLGELLDVQDYADAKGYIKNNTVNFGGKTLAASDLLYLVDLKEKMDNARIEDAKAFCKDNASAFHRTEELFDKLFAVESFKEFVKQLDDRNNIYFSCVLPSARKPAFAPIPDAQMRIGGYLDADHVAELQTMLKALKDRNGDSFLDPAHSVNGELDAQTAIALAAFMTRNSPPPTASDAQNEYIATSIFKSPPTARRSLYKWGAEQTEQLRKEYDGWAASKSTASSSKLSELLFATSLGFALIKAGVPEKGLLSAIVGYLRSKDAKTAAVYDELAKFIISPPQDEKAKSRMALLLSLVISKCGQNAYFKGKDSDIRSFVSKNNAGLADFPDHMVSVDPKVKQITGILDKCGYADRVVDLASMSPVDAMIYFPIANFLMHCRLGAASASNIDLTPRLLRQWADMASQYYGFYLVLGKKDFALAEALTGLLNSSGQEELKAVFGGDAAGITAALTQIDDYNNDLKREAGKKLPLLPKDMAFLRRYINDPRIREKAVAANEHEKNMYWKLYSVIESFANVALITTGDRQELTALADRLEKEGKNLTYDDLVIMKEEESSDKLRRALKALYYNIETAKSDVRDTEKWYKSSQEQLNIPTPPAGPNQVLALRAEYARRPGGEAERIRFLKAEIENIEAKLNGATADGSLIKLKDSYLAELKALCNSLYSTRFSPDFYNWLAEKYTSKGANGFLSGINKYLSGADYYDLIDGKQKGIAEALDILNKGSKAVTDAGGIYSLDINADDSPEIIQVKQALSFFTTMAVSQKGAAKGNINVQAAKSLGRSLAWAPMPSREDDIKQLCVSLYNISSEEDLKSFVDFILGFSAENYNKINKYDLRVLVKFLEQEELPEESKYVTGLLKEALENKANWKGEVLNVPFFSALFSKDPEFYKFIQGETQPTVVGAAESGKVSVTDNDTFVRHYFWMGTPEFWAQQYKNVTEQFEYARDVKKEHVKDMDQILSQFLAQEVTMRTMMPTMIWWQMPSQAVRTFFNRGIKEGSISAAKSALQLVLYPRFIFIWYRRLGEELKQGNYATALALYYALNYLTFRGGWNSVAARTVQPFVELKGILSKFPVLERYVKDPGNPVFRYIKDTGFVRRTMEPRVNSLKERLGEANLAARFAVGAVKFGVFNPWEVGGEGLDMLNKRLQKGGKLARGMHYGMDFGGKYLYNGPLDLPTHTINFATGLTSNFVRTRAEKKKIKTEISRYGEDDRPYVTQLLLEKGYADLNGAGAFAEVEVRNGMFIPTGRGAVPSVLSLIGELKSAQLPKLTAIFNGTKIGDIPIVRVQRNKDVPRPFIIYGESSSGGIYEATFVLPDKLPLSRALEQIGELNNKEVTLPEALFEDHENGISDEFDKIDDEACKGLTEFREKLSNEQIRDVIIKPMVDNIFGELGLTGNGITNLKAIEKLQARLKKNFGETADLSAVSDAIKKGRAVDPGLLRAKLAEKLYDLFVSRYENEISWGLKQPRDMTLDKRNSFMKGIMAVSEQVDKQLEASLQYDRMMINGVVLSSGAGIDKNTYIEYFRSLASERTRDAMNLLRSRISNIIFFTNRLLKPLRWANKIGRNIEIVISESDLAGAEARGTVTEREEEKETRKVRSPERGKQLQPAFADDGKKAAPAAAAGTDIKNAGDSGAGQKAGNLGIRNPNARLMMKNIGGDAVTGFVATGLLDIGEQWISTGYFGKIDWKRTAETAGYGSFGWGTFGLERTVLGSTLRSENIVPYIMGYNYLNSLAMAEDNVAYTGVSQGLGLLTFVLLYSGLARLTGSRLLGLGGGIVGQEFAGRSFAGVYQNSEELRTGMKVLDPFFRVQQDAMRFVTPGYALGKYYEHEGWDTNSWNFIIPNILSNAAAAITIAKIGKKYILPKILPTDGVTGKPVKLGFSRAAWPVFAMTLASGIAEAVEDARDPAQVSMNEYIEMGRTMNLNEAYSVSSQRGGKELTIDMMKCFKNLYLTKPENKAFVDGMIDRYFNGDRKEWEQMMKAIDKGDSDYFKTKGLFGFVQDLSYGIGEMAAMGKPYMQNINWLAEHDDSNKSEKARRFQGMFRELYVKFLDDQAKQGMDVPEMYSMDLSRDGDIKTSGLKNAYMQYLMARDGLKVYSEGQNIDADTKNLTLDASVNTAKYREEVKNINNTRDIPAEEFAGFKGYIEQNRKDLAAVIFRRDASLVSPEIMKALSRRSYGESAKNKPVTRYWISAGTSGDLAINELARGAVISTMDRIAREKFNIPDCHEISLTDRKSRWSMNSIIKEGKQTTSLAWETAVTLARLGYIRKDMIKGLSEKEQEQLMEAFGNVDFNDIRSVRRAFNAYMDFLKASEASEDGGPKGHKAEALKKLLAEAVMKFQKDIAAAGASAKDELLISEMQTGVYGPATARWMIKKYMEKK